MRRARAASRFIAWVRDEAGLDLERQRRRLDVEAELHGCRDLVDVLAAGSRRADEALLDLALVERQRRRDLQSHGVYRVIGQRSSSTRIEVASMTAMPSEIGARADCIGSPERGAP